MILSHSQSHHGPKITPQNSKIDRTANKSWELFYRKLRKLRRKVHSIRWLDQINKILWFVFSQGQGRWGFLLILRECSSQRLVFVFLRRSKDTSASFIWLSRTVRVIRVCVSSLYVFLITFLLFDTNTQTNHLKSLIWGLINKKISRWFQHFRGDVRKKILFSLFW